MKATGLGSAGLGYRGAWSRRASPASPAPRGPPGPEEARLFGPALIVFQLRPCRSPKPAQRSPEGSSPFDGSLRPDAACSPLLSLCRRIKRLGSMMRRWARRTLSLAGPRLDDPQRRQYYALVMGPAIGPCHNFVTVFRCGRVARGICPRNASFFPWNSLVFLDRDSPSDCAIPARRTASWSP
jgi:hypothetical protein